MFSMNRDEMINSIVAVYGRGDSGSASDGTSRSFFMPTHECQAHEVAFLARQAPRRPSGFGKPGTRSAVPGLLVPHERGLLEGRDQSNG